MKHSISFHKLKSRLFESFLQINESRICNGSSSWPRIDDIQSANIPHNIKIVMEFLQNTWPENKGLPCISAFKLSPSISNNDKKYELYVYVKTVGDGIENNRVGRRNFYQIINKFFKKQYTLNKTYLIGSATKSLAGKTFELGNFGKIDLAEDDILASELQNTLVVLGLFTHSEESNLPVLDTIIKFRIEEDRTEKTENNNTIKCILVDANSVLKQIFGSDNWKIGDKSGLSPTTFSNKLLSVIHDMNVLPEEEEMYKTIFKNTKYTSSFSTSVWENIKIGNTTFAEFMYDSNILVVLSELLIPWLLINGVQTFNGINLINELAPKKSTKVESVQWPTEHSNQSYDYSILFSDSDIPVNISAKAGDGHKVSAIAEISDNADDIITDKNIKGSVIQLCAKAISKANSSKAISRQTSVFYCWCMAAALYKKSITDSDIEQLYTIFKKLSTTNEYPADAERMTKLSRNDASIIESLTGVKYSNIFDNEKESWPYSLTHIFERIVVSALQDEKGNVSKDYFYSTKMNQENKYYQIELFKSKKQCIIIKIKAPQDIEDISDSSEKFKFTVLTGSGNILVRKEEYATHGKCINIALGKGSRGQVIGVKLL